MRLLCNLQGIEVGGMAPTEAMRSVFLWRVLGILNEEIRIVYQRRVAGRFDQVPRRCGFAKGSLSVVYASTFPLAVRR